MPLHSFSGSSNRKGERYGYPRASGVGIRTAILMKRFSKNATTGRHWGWLARLSVWWALGAILATLVLAACSPDTPAKFDFGDQKNHIHSMLALPGKAGTVLLATHYGLFRTTDGGKTWKKVLGGSGQLAQGLMDQYLTV